MFANVTVLALLGAAFYVLVARKDKQPKLTFLESTHTGHFAPSQEITREDAREVGDMLNVNWADVDLREFRAGLQDELEHYNITDGDVQLTAEIALAHLEEDPEYYTKIKSVLS